MILPVHLTRWSISRRRLNKLNALRACYSTKRSKPLRILFCGSDEFSAGSLRALHQEQQRDPEGVKSIDVLCRPGKRTGRSMKVIREVPIKSVAEELGLRIHQRDTFTGWNLPNPDGEAINLIIAVSFGLFVPPRILKSAEYGGLNVHPSLLPDLRGAAPLQWAILEGYDTTGVTLQTLDDKSFDHGKILLQTPPLNLPKLGLHKPTYPSLRDLVTSHAQQLLVQGIRERVFVSPVREIPMKSDSRDLIFARKLKAKDAEMDWLKSSTQIARQYRALGPLWSIMQLRDGSKTRVKFDDVEELPAAERQIRGRLLAVGSSGEIPLSFSNQKDGSIVILGNGRTGVDGSVQDQEVDLRVGRITIEGKSKMAARMATEVLKLEG